MYLYETAIAVLAVVIFLLDNISEKRPVSLTSKVLHVLKIFAAHWLKITAVLNIFYICFKCS